MPGIDTGPRSVVGACVRVGQGRVLRYLPPQRTSCPKGTCFHVLICDSRNDTQHTTGLEDCCWYCLGRRPRGWTRQLFGPFPPQPGCWSSIRRPLHLHLAAKPPPSFESLQFSWPPWGSSTMMNAKQISGRACLNVGIVSQKLLGAWYSLDSEGSMLSTPPPRPPHESRRGFTTARQAVRGPCCDAPSTQRRRVARRSASCAVLHHLIHGSVPPGAGDL